MEAKRTKISMSTIYFQTAGDALEDARSVKRFIIRNPSRYDSPRNREIILGNVRRARYQNHLGLDARREEHRIS